MKLDSSREMSVLSQFFFSLHGTYMITANFKGCTMKLTMWWLDLSLTCCYKKQACDKRYFYYCYDRAMDTTLCSPFWTSDQRFRKSSLHLEGSPLYPAQRDRKKERGGPRHEWHNISVKLPQTCLLTCKNKRAVGQI